MSSFLTSQQAARLLGKGASTATRRAREAFEAGDPEVLRVGKAWAAPEAWWREHLRTKPLGRPRLRDTAADAPPDTTGPHP
jgi:hypothetical protein